MAVPESQMSFSGQDTKVYAFVPGPTAANQTKLVELTALQTLSISTFRDKVPVRALGHVNTLGYSRGPRTVAGSMVFAILHDHPLAGLEKVYSYDFSFDTEERGQGPRSPNSCFPDIIPPFHLLARYQNEMGRSAILVVFGVDLSNEGIVTSTEDMYTEKTYQFQARNMEVFFALPGRKGAGLPKETDEEFRAKISLAASDLLWEGESFTPRTSSSISIPAASLRSNR